MYYLLISSLVFFIIGTTQACVSTTLNSCRDIKALESRHIGTLQIKQLRKRYQSTRSELKSKLIQLPSHADEQLIFTLLFKLPEVEQHFDQCMQNLSEIEQRLEMCQSFILEDLIRLAFADELIDETSSLILKHQATQNKRAPFFGRITDYAGKIRLIQKNRNLNRNDSPITEATLNHKNHRTSFGKLKKITPRQKLLLQYNYTQIKYMGDILLKLDRRMQAQRAGVFYDYNNDGIADDSYIIDAADQYRMTVKLLKLELEKESHQGGMFADNKPTFTDLLSAAEELGLIESEQLKVMLDLPELNQKKEEKWKMAGKIAYNIGKGVLMVIPGVNIYAIIPIVLVESYFENKKLQNNTSDLHLF
jgi:hypothetical protein